jgi:transcriptional regulator with XRE-family HTH domain
MDDVTAAMARAIGLRVRSHRQDHGWTLDQLAGAADVSRRMLINVEQGAVNPSVGTLLRISDALGVGLPALVAPLDRETVTVTRKSDGAVLWTGDNGGRGVLVAGTEPPDVVELWDWSLGPDDSHTSEAHAAGTQELIQVQQGEVLVQVGEQTWTLKVGDAIAFPGDLPHSYSNRRSRPARFTLAVFEPGLTSPRTETP